MKDLVYIALGSNLGDRRATLHRALEEISRLEGVRVCRTSSLLETRPEGYEAQPDFINAVAELVTDLPPETLLEHFQAIENKLGRVRTERWGPRTLDLDILLYGFRVIHTRELDIPHPRMHQRRFVLKPLCELIPDLAHPTEHKTIRQLLQQLDPVAV